MAELIFRFRASETDILEPSLTAAKRSRAAKWWSLFWVALFVGAIALSASRPRGDKLSLWLMLALIATYALVYLGSMTVLRYRIRRDPRNSDEYVYTFSERGFASRNSQGKELLWNWSEIVAVVETKTGYLIDHKDCRCILPRRAIPDDSHEAAFYDLVRFFSPDRGAHLARERLNGRGDR